MTAAETLTFEVDLDAPPGQVWRALTEPDLLAAWLAPGAVGPDFGGPIDCRLLEAEPGRSLRYAWLSEGEGGPLETEVLFEVAETEAGGARLRITHSGFEAAVTAQVSPRVVSLAAHRLRRQPTPPACIGGLKWAA